MSSSASRRYKSRKGGSDSDESSPVHGASRRDSQAGQFLRESQAVPIGNDTAQTPANSASPHRQTTSGGSTSHAHALAALERRCLVMISLAEKEAARRHTQLLQRVRDLESTVAEKDSLIDSLIGSSEVSDEAKTSSSLVNGAAIAKISHGTNMFDVLRTAEASLRLFSNNLSSAKSVFVSVHGDITARLGLLCDQRIEVEGKILLRVADSLQLYAHYNRYLHRRRLSVNLSHLLNELGHMRLRHLTAATERRRLERAIRRAERAGEQIHYIKYSEAEGEDRSDPINDSTSSEDEEQHGPVIGSSDNRASRALTALLSRHGALLDENDEELDFPSFVALMPSSTGAPLLDRLAQRITHSEDNNNNQNSSDDLHQQIPEENDLPVQTSRYLGVSNEELSILSPLSQRVVALEANDRINQRRESPNRSYRERENADRQNSPHVMSSDINLQSNPTIKLSLFGNNEAFYQSSAKKVSELDAELILSLMGKRQFKDNHHLSLGSWLLRPLRGDHDIPSSDNDSGDTTLVPNRRLESFLLSAVNRGSLFVGDGGDEGSDISLATQPMLMYLCGAVDLLQRYSDEITIAHTVERRKLRALQQNVLLRPERMWLKSRAEDLCFRELPRLEVSTQALANVFLNQIASTAEERTAQQLDLFTESNKSLHRQVCDELRNSALPKHHSTLVGMVADGLFVSPSQFLDTIQRMVDMPAKGWWALSWRQVLKSVTLELFDPSAAYLRAIKGDKAGKSKLYASLEETRKLLQRELDEFAVWINTTSGGTMTPRGAIQMGALDLNHVLQAAAEGHHPIIAATLDKQGLSFSARQLLLKLKKEDVAKRLGKALCHIWKTFHSELQSSGSDHTSPLATIEGPALVLQKNSVLWTLLKAVSKSRCSKGADKPQSTSNQRVSYNSSSETDDDEEGTSYPHNVGTNTVNHLTSKASDAASDDWDLIDDFTDWVRLDDRDGTSWKYKSSNSKRSDVNLADNLLTLSNTVNEGTTIRSTDISSLSSATRANQWTHALADDDETLPIIITNMTRADKRNLRKGDPTPSGGIKLPSSIVTSQDLVRKIVDLFANNVSNGDDVSTEDNGQATLALMNSQWDLLYEHQRRQLAKFNSKKESHADANDSWTIRTVSKAFPLLVTKAYEVDDELYEEHERNADSVLSETLPQPQRLLSAVDAILSAQHDSSTGDDITHNKTAAAFSLLSYASPLRSRTRQKTSVAGSPYSPESPSSLSLTNLGHDSPNVVAKGTGKAGEGVQWHNLMEVSNTVTVSTNLTYASMTAEGTGLGKDQGTGHDSMSSEVVGTILTPVMVDSILLSADAAIVEHTDRGLHNIPEIQKQSVGERISTLHFGTSGDQENPSVGSWHTLRYTTLPPGVSQRNPATRKLTPFIKECSTNADGGSQVPLLRTPLLESSSPYGGLVDIREQRFLGPYSHLVRKGTKNDVRTISMATPNQSAIRPHFDSASQQPNMHSLSATVVYVNTVLAPPPHLLSLSSTLQHAVTVPDRLISGLLLKALGDYSTLSSQFSALLCALEWRIRERYFFTGYEEEDEERELEAKGTEEAVIRETTVRRLDNMIKAANQNVGMDAHEEESSDDVEEEHQFGNNLVQDKTNVFNDFDEESSLPMPNSQRSVMPESNNNYTSLGMAPQQQLSIDHFQSLYKVPTEHKLRGHKRRQMTAKIFKTKKAVSPIVVVNFSLSTLRQEAARVDFLRRTFSEQIERQKALHEISERTWKDKETDLLSHINHLQQELAEAQNENANMRQELTSLQDQLRNREELQNLLVSLPEKIVDVKYSVTTNTFGEGWQESILKLLRAVQDQCLTENEKLLTKVKFWVQDNPHGSAHSVLLDSSARNEARIAATLKAFTEDQRNQFEVAKHRFALEKQRNEDEMWERINTIEEAARKQVEDSALRHEQTLQQRLHQMEEQYIEKIRTLEARQRDKEAELNGKLHSLRIKYRAKENELTAKMDDLRIATQNELEDRLSFHRDEFALANTKRDDELIQCKRDHETVQRNLRNFYNNHFLEMCGNLQELVIASRQELQEIFFVDRWENMRQSMVLFSQIQKTAEDAKQKHYREVVLDTYVKGLNQQQEAFTQELAAIEGRYQLEISQREITHVKHFDEFRIQREDHLRATAETRAQQNQVFWTQCQQTLMNAERYMAQYRAEVDVTFQRRRQNLVASCQEYLEKDVSAARKAFEAELNLRREQLHNSIVQYHRLDIKQLQLSWEEVSSRALVEKTFFTSLHSLKLQETNESETRLLMEHNIINSAMVDRYQWGAMQVGGDDTDGDSGDEDMCSITGSKRADSLPGESPGPASDEDREGGNNALYDEEANDITTVLKQRPKRKKKSGRIVFGRLTALPPQAIPSGTTEAVGGTRSGSVLEHSNASHRITELFIPRSDLVSMRAKYENRIISLEREKEQLCRDFLSAMQSQVQLSKQDVTRQHQLATNRTEIIADHLKEQFSFASHNNNFMIETRLENIASEAEKYLLAVDKEVDSGDDLDGERAPSLVLGLSKVHTKLIAAEKGLTHESSKTLSRQALTTQQALSPSAKRRAASLSPSRNGRVSRTAPHTSPSRAKTPPVGATGRNALGISSLTNKSSLPLQQPRGAAQSTAKSLEMVPTTTDTGYEGLNTVQVSELQETIKNLRAKVRYLTHKAKYKRSLTELLGLLFGDGIRRIRKSDNIEERILFFGEKVQEEEEEGVVEGAAKDSMTLMISGSDSTSETDEGEFTVITNDENIQHQPRRSVAQALAPPAAKIQSPPKSQEHDANQNGVVAKAHKALAELISAPISLDAKGGNNSITISPRKRVLKGNKSSKRIQCGNAAITLGYYLTMKQRMQALMEAFTASIAAYADDNGRKQAALVQGIHQQYVVASGNLLSKIEGYSAMTANKAQLANHLATRIELAMEEVRVSEFTCASLRSALREFATFNRKSAPLSAALQGDEKSSPKYGNKASNTEDSLMITIPKSSVSEMASMREQNFVHEWLLAHRNYPNARGRRRHAEVVDISE